MENIDSNFVFKENKQLKNKRKKYNNKILKTIKEYLKQHEDFRFIQALTVLGVISNIDRFNEESEVTHHRIQSRLQQMRNMQFNVGMKID